MEKMDHSKANCLVLSLLLQVLSYPPNPDRAGPPQREEWLHLFDFPYALMPDNLWRHSDPSNLFACTQSTLNSCTETMVVEWLD